jgi:hypothetical protein
MIAEPHVDQCDIGVDGRICLRPCFLVLDYVFGFDLLSRHGVNVGEIGVESPAVTGRLNRSLKLRNGFIVTPLCRGSPGRAAALSRP